MATEEDERRMSVDENAPHDSDSDSSTGDEASSDAVDTPTVEWLVTGREKRSTAGNRMKHMLAVQEPDDDLELLFAEDGEDAAFSDAGDDGSDLQMDSSSDEEDAQENADEMEGEKELEKQARENRQAARKRKAQEAIPLKFRKKVKIAPAASEAPTPSAPTPRPKKKSERTSWLPSVADMPIRASKRETTMMSKEQLHQQMIEREVKRIKQVEAMERKAKKMEALKKPPKTQAERLAEAAIIEKKNAKSLNRWEEAEKQREEERRARLAALNNRTLDGPVVTFWSGAGEWVDGKLKHVGKIVTIEEKPQKKKRASAIGTDDMVQGLSKNVESSDVEAGPNNSKDEEPATATAPTAEPLANTQASGQSPSLPPSGAPAENITPPMPSETPKDPATSDQSPRPASPEATSAVAPPEDTAVSSNVVSEVGSSTPPRLEVKAEETVPVSLSTSILPQEEQSQSLSATEEPTQDLKLSSTDEVAASKANVEEPVAPVEATTTPNPDSQQPSPVDVPQPAIKAPNLMPPSTHSYTTSRFAPPAQPGLMKPPNLKSPSTSFLAPPAGVGQGGLSMPMIGHCSTPSSSSNVLAAPRMTQNQPPFSIPKTNSGTPPATAPSPTPARPAQNLATPAPKIPVKDQAPPATSTPATPLSSLKLTKANAAKQKQEAETPLRPPTPPPNGKATRNCIILQNFNENAIKEKPIQTRILFGKEMNKLPKPTPAPKCVITNHPARYRDPKTGLPFYNSYAYKEIQKLQRGEYKWSKLVGAWLGSGSQAATGVPARFLDPTAPAPPKPKAPAADEPDVSKPTETGEVMSKTSADSNQTIKDVPLVATPIPKDASASTSPAPVVTTQDAALTNSQVVEAPAPATTVSAPLPAATPLDISPQT